MEYAFGIWMLVWVIVIYIAIFLEAGRRQELAGYRAVIRVKSIAMIVFFVSGAISLLVPGGLWSDITGWAAFTAMVVAVSAIWVFRIFMHKRSETTISPNSSSEK